MALPPETLPWYKSRVLVGALVSAVFKLLYLSGLASEIGDNEMAQWVDLAMLLASFVGDYMAARARLVQKHAPPITATKGTPYA